jgi:hypothetical protein
VTNAVVAIDAVASNGDFEIAGTVLDAQGAQLGDVTMTVEASKYLGFDFDPPGGGGGVETKERTQRWVKHVDGAFEVKTGRFSDLSLRFAKKGYESRTLSFAIDRHGPREDASAGDRRSFRGPAPLRLRAIRVLLPPSTTPK